MFHRNQFRIIFLVINSKFFIFFWPANFFEIFLNVPRIALKIFWYFPQTSQKFSESLFNFIWEPWNFFKISFWVSKFCPNFYVVNLNFLRGLRGIFWKFSSWLFLQEKPELPHIFSKFLHSANTILVKILIEKGLTFKID